MIRLIKASLIRYIKSSVPTISLSCSLVFGVIHGILEWKMIHFDFENYFNKSVWLSSPMSDIWFKCSIWVVIVLISSELGKEFSDGTIRNKLYVGHTRMAIYLSEIVVSSVIVFFHYLVFMIPTVIGGSCFFYTMSPVACLSLLGELLLFFLVWGIFSAVLTMLIADRAVGVAAVFSIMLFLAVINVNLRSYYYNTEPAEITETIIDVSEDGKPYSLEQTVKNPWYTEGLPKALVNIEHEVDPFSRAYNACNYAYIHFPEKAGSGDFDLKVQIDRQVKYDCLELLLTGAILTVVGAVLFRKKDLK